jgi:hypothetical protein
MSFDKIIVQIKEFPKFPSYTKLCQFDNIHPNLLIYTHYIIFKLGMEILSPISIQGIISYSKLVHNSPVTEALRDNKINHCTLELHLSRRWLSGLAWPFG